jgi:hypothetical protein
MTALDDALNQSSVVFLAPSLLAHWREAGPAEETLSEDARTNLSGQMTGAWSIDHSLDDGLPDPVTMTTGNDASGKLSAGLNGKTGMKLDVCGYRGSASNDGWSNIITTGGVVAGTQVGDYVVCTIVVDNGAALLVPQLTNDTDPRYLWQQLGMVADGSGLALWVFGTRYWGPGFATPTFLSDTVVNYIGSNVSIYATNPAGYPLDWKVTDSQTYVAASSTSTHSVTTTLQHKGIQMVVWSTTAVSDEWFPVLGRLDSRLSRGMAMAISTSPQASSLKWTPKQAGVYTVTGNTTDPETNVAVVGLSLEPFERPTMDARQYWSPFNVDSPVYGYDRDTADMTLDFGVVTATGRVDTRLFAGIMEDITISGRQATVDATSKARIDLNAAVSLPMVYGYRENCSIDFVLAYLMARGGKFVGPAPNEYTQAWVPMYGSTHSGLEGEYYYNFGLYNNASTGGNWFGLKPPAVVKGPYSSAMFACQTATESQEIKCTFIRPDLWSDFSLPYLTPGDINNNDPSATTQLRIDPYTQGNSKVRFTAWVRGDAVQSAPAYLGSNDDFIFNVYHYISDSFGYYYGYVRFYCSASTRAIGIQMGSTNAGFWDSTFSSIGTLPTDGNWHFVGFSADYAAGRCDFTIDGGGGFSTVWASNGVNDSFRLPYTFAEGLNNGWRVTSILRSHVPISDVLLDFGPTFHSGDWAMFYPTPKAPGVTAVLRPTFQQLQALTVDAPVVAWDTIAELAQSVFASYRANESDQMEFLPLDYFGEAAQLVSQAVQDTDVNAGDLNVTSDPSRSRNSVTVQFPETQVDTFYSPVLQLSTVMSINRGISTFTFPLDTPIAEIHGQSSPFFSWWTLTNLTASQISTPPPPSNVHWCTPNTASDGSGAVIDPTRFIATIINGTATTITIQFNNQSGATAYLANNGDQVPFLQILGYAVKTSDGYVTQNDAGSIGSRRQRALTTQLNWIQDRTSATDKAGILASMLARPRTKVTVQIAGDPRRKPGHLVTIKDSQGTQAAGLWRILSISHNGAGPQYTQDLTLVQVAPTLVWDDPTTTWDYAVWGE